MLELMVGTLGVDQDPTISLEKFDQRSAVHAAIIHTSCVSSISEQLSWITSPKPQDYIQFVITVSQVTPIRAWVEGRMVYLELSDERVLGFPAEPFAGSTSMRI